MFISQIFKNLNSGNILKFNWLRRHRSIWLAPDAYSKCVLKYGAMGMSSVHMVGASVLFYLSVSKNSTYLSGSVRISSHVFFQE